MPFVPSGAHYRLSGIAVLSNTMTYVKFAYMGARASSPRCDDRRCRSTVSVPQKYRVITSVVPHKYSTNTFRYRTVTVPLLYRTRTFVLSATVHTYNFSCGSKVTLRVSGGEPGNDANFFAWCITTFVFALVGEWCHPWPGAGWPGGEGSGTRPATSSRSPGL